MYNIKIKIMDFIRNGFSVLGRSSRADYNSRTKEVEDLRKEFLKRNHSSVMTDKINLKSDRKNIGLDMRHSISKIVIE